jgi:cation diffusion facilitator family transporter
MKTEKSDIQGIGPDVSLMEIRQARKRAAFSILLNLLLTLGKGVAGVVGGSSALIGDAIHSATDVVGSLAAWFGLWLAGKKHPSFPYGLYKAETLATLVTSVAVMIAGYEIARQAFLGPIRIPDIALTLPVALLSLVIALGFGFYQLYAGRRLHSKALEADARDYLADGLSTLVVVISLVGGYFNLSLDRWAAGVVSLFVFWSGGNLLWRAARDLMDQAIDRDTERDIIELAESHPYVERVEQCLSRMAGGRYIVDLDVVFRSGDLSLAHRIGHHIEDDIRSRFPRVVMTSVRIHSREPSDIRRMTPVRAQGGEIEESLTRAPWFLVESLDRESGSTIDHEYVQNPYCEAGTRRGLLVGKWILGRKPDQVVVLMKDENTAIVLLEESGVEIVVSKGK